MVDNTDHIKQLKLQRGTLKSQITRFKTFLDNSKPEEKAAIQIKIRKEKAELVYDQFLDIQSKIELGIGCAEEIERDEFENAYFNTCALAESLLEKCKIPESTSSNNSCSGTCNGNCVDQEIKLPPINLPTFDGSYDKWLLFYETFEAIIHKNIKLNNIRKFQYLQSSLKGEALEIIRSLELSDANYLVAWQLLNKRYHNNKFMIFNHVKGIMELTEIRKESYTDLRKLSDSLQKHIKALEILKQPVNSWDTIVIYIMASKLDYNTSKEWETLISKKKDSEMPTLTEFTDFLDQRCRLLEVIQKNKIEKAKATEKDTNFKHYTKNSTKNSAAFVTTIDNCELCQEYHKLYNCQKFLEMSVSDRINHINKAKRCYNCLNTSHSLNECRSRGCKYCSKRHNSLLHMEKRATNTQNAQHKLPQQQFMQTRSYNNSNLAQAEPSVSSTSCNSAGITEVYTTQTKPAVILSTALVMVPDKDGHKRNLRVLLDSASQSNFITKENCRKLGLTPHKVNSTVTGFGNKLTPITEQVKATVYSKTSNYKITLNFLVINQITDNLPLVTIPRSCIEIPSHMRLADPYFYESKGIDMLIGAEIFFQLLCAEQLQINKHLPILQNSYLGWIVSGKIEKSTNNNSSLTLLTLEKQLEKFWAVEEISHNNNLNKEEQEVEMHFLETYKRDEEGRFTVRLPFNSKKHQLNNSKTEALNRFRSMERKLTKDSVLKTEYNEFMKEYESLGHMEKVVHTTIPDDCYFLPHHAVCKEDSLTTKTRIVFDGSAITSSGISLNDVLKKGPVVQDELFNTLLRFRIHNIVLTADISKMYRQIRVSEHDTNYQLIFWRSHPDEEIKTYKLNTVTYGTKSAPYLATRCLNQLAVEEEQNYCQKACNTLRHDFYVDDLLTGTTTVDEAQKLANNLIELLAKGGFALRKWRSNSKLVLSRLSEIQTKEDLMIIDNSTAKTLGMYWDSDLDNFQYQVKPLDKLGPITKRKILAGIAQIYDPLGLLGPVLTRAKLLMQELWKDNISWDEQPPKEISLLWTNFTAELKNLNQLLIPRKMTSHTKYKFIDLHGFCDASTKAYGACIYIHTQTESNEHSVELLCSKSRIAPLKTITLPRLELCGALLLSQLLKKVQDSLKITINKTYLWTDSTITLAWISSRSYQFKTFVSHRITEIQNLTENCKWNHVSGRDNPADLISRGTSPSNLLHNELWFQGPYWLTKIDISNQEADIPYHIFSDTILERKKQNPCIVTIQCDPSIIERYSTYTKLQRIIGWCLRFKNNTLNRNDRNVGDLTVRELRHATEGLVKMDQHTYFTEEIESLKKSRTVKTSSKIISLSPFLDDNNILRVGGRIQAANISDNQKHPFILSSQSHLVKLIIRHEHEMQFHAGTQCVLYHLRLKYWIIGAKNAIKGIIRNCIICFKARPHMTQPLMGNLPEKRIQTANPFEVTGVDYGGPMMIREGHRRGRIRTEKCYIAVFVCFVTKAVHIELVSSLTAEAFIATLRRFVARRGKCKHLYSDNATNFRGAHRELQQFTAFLRNETTQNKINRELISKGITWHFIPPKSPHFGGLWESSVRSIKHHIKRTIGNTLLTFEEYATILAQIEYCLNGRPLCPISSDPNDLSPLTPLHFLSGDSLNTDEIEDIDLTNVPTNTLSKWQHLQKLKQHIWKRWKTEYLSTLNQRHKWTTASPNLNLGDMVLLVDDLHPSLQWSLGRVIELHVGPDGAARVVSVRTQHGQVKRAAVKVCKLPI